MDDQKLQKLKDLIDLALEQCDAEEFPHVCSMARNPENREGLGNMIIAQVKESGISVNSAINRIERAYNPNRIDD
jgi:hypothetical protein